MGFKIKFSKLKYVVSGLAIFFLVAVLSSCGIFREDSSAGVIVREVTQESQVNEAYQKAKAAYLWFYYEPLSYESYVKVESGSSTQEELGPKIVEDVKYYKAFSDEIGNYNQLKSYLGTLFSEEIVNDLLSGESSKVKYKNIDNFLYGTIPAVRPPQSVKKEAYSIRKINPYKYVYSLSVDMASKNNDVASSSESYEYIYEFVNDRWVFTKFHLFY